MYASSTAQTISELSAFERMLVSGGDGRIAIDPQTGRTRYYTPRGKACDETWFSSSTATAISVRGYDATRQACRSLGDASDIQLVSGCFHRIRARLLALFGIPGSEAILSGSGTELEIIALFLARSLMRGAATNLVVGPAETGRGKALQSGRRSGIGSRLPQRMLRSGENRDPCSTFSENRSFFSRICRSIQCYQSHY